LSAAVVAPVGPGEEDDCQSEQEAAQGFYSIGITMREGLARDKEQVGRREQEQRSSTDAASFGIESVSIREAHEFFS
jgi:hypothetical protein